MVHRHEGSIGFRPGAIEVKPGCQFAEGIRNIAGKEILYVQRFAGICQCGSRVGPLRPCSGSLPS